MFRVGMKPPCVAPDCHRRARSRTADYCDLHYMRMRRNGSLDRQYGPQNRPLRGLTLEQVLAQTSERHPSGCLLWTGSVNRGGYGTTGGKKTRRQVHRVAFELANGFDAPETVGHTCHDRAVLDGTCAGGPSCYHRRCIEPTHLTAESMATNWQKSGNIVARIKAGMHVITCPLCQSYHNNGH